MSPEELALFMGAIDGAVPLPARDRIKVEPVRTAVVPASTLPPTHPITIDRNPLTSGGDDIMGRAPGVNRAQMAEVRRGRIRVEATVDLHGLTIAAAGPTFEKFLLDSARLRRRCVLVIHGKGLHSDGVAVLREFVIAQLCGPLSGLVTGFTTAAPADGGAGASYILVRT